MSQSNNRIPTYCRHKSTGQAYVLIDGRMIYLGRYGSPASRAEYDRIITEWLASGRRLPTDPLAVTIAEVVAAFRRHALTYYRDADGNVSKHVTNLDDAVKPLLALYSDLPALGFGPLRLKSVRQKMIEQGHVRSSINRRIARIKHVFRWASENEMIPGSVLHGLTALAGLQAGRCGAAESEPVKPVAAEHVEPVLSNVSRQVAAMIRLQLLTAMRPGEVVAMRGADLDTTSKLWVYRPRRHKNQFRGKDRIVYLGPRAQGILRAFLKTDLSAPIFSPAEAEAERRANVHNHRKTPMNQGNKPGTNRRRRPIHKPGSAYTTGSYLVAIYRGCDRAFPPPPEIAADSAELVHWRKEHRFHPNQLRHTAGTSLRTEYGLETAGAILGHSRLETSQIYCETNANLAKAAMTTVG